VPGSTAERRGKSAGADAIGSSQSGRVVHCRINRTSDRGKHGLDGGIGIGQQSMLGFAYQQQY